MFRLPRDGVSERAVTGPSNYGLKEILDMRNQKTKKLTLAASTLRTLVDHGVPSLHKAPPPSHGFPASCPPTCEPPV